MKSPSSTLEHLLEPSPPALKKLYRYTEYRFWFCFLDSAVLLDGTGSYVRGIWVRFWFCSFAGGEDAGFCFGGQLSRTLCAVTGNSVCQAGHH